MTVNTNTAQRVHTYSCLNHGGTFDRRGDQPAEGFAVTVSILDAVPFLGIARIDEALHLEVGEGNYLGTWFDHENGRWEISETAVIRNREDALTLARSMGERYIFDLAAGEEVKVEEAA